MDDPGTDTEFTFYGLNEWNYRVDVRATDRVGNRATHYITFTVDLSATTMDIELVAAGDADGWNFVSFNLIPADTSLMEILEEPEHGISGKYDSVMYYDVYADQWKSYVPGRAEHFNNLDTWNHRMGLWIRMTENATLTVEGHAPTSTDITLYPGWNMVGYPSDTIRIGSDILPEEVTKVGVFARNEDYNVAYHTDLTNVFFSPGRGYWLYSEGEEPVVWTVGY